MIKILGIDPGSRYSGFALIEKRDRKFSYIKSGYLNFSQEKNFFLRLRLIFEQCSDLINQLQPDQISIESLIHVKNINSLAKLSQARGVIIASCYQYKDDIKIVEYAPNLVKSSISGFGHIDKNQLAETLKLIFKLDKNFKFSKDDESDALAIALTHGLQMKISDPRFKQDQQFINNKVIYNN